jgi:chemotaxis protein CheY-P-specific phosphatase CheC
MSHDIIKRENFLTVVFNKGFQRAAESFSKLIHKPVNVMPVTVSDKSTNDTLGAVKKSSELVALTTKVIGDITGKSYLLLNAQDCDAILRSYSYAGNQIMADAFLLEIDNIISASVIAELSNALQIEIYGDVPQLIRVRAQELKKFAAEELNVDDASKLILTSTTFEVDNRQIQPYFIWKLSRAVFDLIPEQRLVA